MALQVDNDIALLEKIIADEQSNDKSLSATARWSSYSESFVGYLRSEGLVDFRSRRHSKGSPGAVLAQFGAVDRNPDFTRPNGKPEDMYHAARTTFAGKSAVPIEDLPAGKVGNPEGFEIEGRFYTLSWLNYYCRYAYVSHKLRLNDQIIVEVGPGSGKQAEMLKRAHPGLTIVLFDLPTQIYVCNQYLTKVFSGTDQVADYASCRTMESFSDIQKGKINILPHWKFSMVNGEEFDLLWNAASFQEMGTGTAKRYLDQAAGAKAMYLMHNIKYRKMVDAPGERGVISGENLPLFREGHRELARLALPLETWQYFDSFWTRKPVKVVAARKPLNIFQRARRKASHLLKTGAD